ncbi:MAG: K(+)-transporting ATPase subunit C [Desulfomonilaceae bacterium]
MKDLITELRISLIATLLLALIVSGIYPVLVWGIAEVLFPQKANGSLIVRDGKTIGSELLAQNFTDPKYFHSRPSAAGDVGYDATSSGGSNLGPTSKKLIDSVKERIEAYRAENNLPAVASVPADAVTASASGLDPHISVKNALIQAGRVAKERGISEQAILAKVQAHVEARDLGILGEPRVNVLKLNLSLDAR